MLAACESDLDRRYLDTSLGKPLELPPDLSEFESESGFELPGSIQGSGAVDEDGVPVLAKVDSVRLQGGADLYWLEVDDTVENLYQHVKNFWAAEGYGLLLDEPIIGMMETEWIYTEEGGDHKSDSWWAVLFDSEDLSATQDQFVTRLERDPSGSGSRIYIAHRGTEYVHQIEIGDTEGEGDTDNEWQHREAEPELEIEMLSRLMIYLGVQQAEVDQQVEQAELFKPRAVLLVDAEERSPFIIVKDPYHLAWNRVYHVVTQMNMEINFTEFKSGIAEEGAISVKSKVVKKEESKGFFSFGSTEDSVRDFVLVLSEETHDLTRVIIEDDKGQFDTTPEGSEFLTQLYKQLK